MSDPRAARDADGHPIVAELGRAETPDETWERKQASRRAHRTNQTAFNLVIAVVASLGLVLFLVLVVVRPDQSSLLKDVNWTTVAKQAQESTSSHILSPSLPSGWTSNRAEWDGDPADDVPHFSVGFVTPDRGYAALDQGIKGTDGWVVDLLQQKRATGTTTIDGTAWTVYDHRDDDDPGNLAYALETTLDGSRVVLSGTASTADFRTLARAVTADAEAHDGGNG